MARACSRGEGAWSELQTAGAEAEGVVMTKDEYLSRFQADFNVLEEDMPMFDAEKCWCGGIYLGCQGWLVTMKPDKTVGERYGSNRIGAVNSGIPVGTR